MHRAEAGVALIAMSSPQRQYERPRRTVKPDPGLCRSVAAGNNPVTDADRSGAFS